jgi:hypothetical protein
MPNFKKFDKKLYNQNDNKARKAGIKFWKSKGYNIQNNPDEFGPDLIAEKDGDSFFVEVEVKHNWNKEQFPFNDLQIPERKKKFATIAQKTYFMVFNSILNRAFICSNKTLLNSPLQNISNKYMDNENFFKIPVSKLKLVEI